MAWSYTKPSGVVSQIDGGFQANWTNSWTVAEVTPTQTGCIRLRVTVTTGDFYSSSGSYAWYSADTMSCGGTTISVHARSRVPGAASYTAYVQVPQSWSGRTVSMNIAWTAVSVQLNATGVTPSAITASDGEFGHAIPITLTPAVSGVQHTVTVSCAGRTETLLTQSTATSVSWLPDLAVYAALLPNAGSASAAISCETFASGVSMGSASRTITLRFAAGELPPALSPGWASASVLNEGAASGFTVWIQGWSRAQIVFDSAKISCLYGAGIAGFAISCEGLRVSAAPYRTGVLSGTAASIVCTVTDSRGQTASETLTVALESCAAPSLTALSIFRSDPGGEPDENGTGIAVQATALYSSLGGENSAELRAFVRRLDQDFGGAGTALASAQRAVLGPYSPDTSYEVKLTLTDGLGRSAQATRVLPSRVWAMKFRPGGDGVAFGKAAETSAALELGPGWVLALHDGNGNTATLSYAELTALKALL